MGNETVADRLLRWMSRAMTTAGKMRAQGNKVGERYYTGLAAGYFAQYERMTNAAA